MFGELLAAYGLPEQDYALKPIGSGLINHTWMLQHRDDGNDFVLQKINRQVFNRPGLIADNIAAIADFLSLRYPQYLFITPVQNKEGKALYMDHQEIYYRLYPFIKNSLTINEVQAAEQAYEAARQFGQFTRLLDGMDHSHLHVVLPDFHNLSLRFALFKKALVSGIPERMTAAAELVAYLLAQKEIVDTYEMLVASPEFVLRVIHHDAKINNILFDANGKGLCVIDLDTVMPGYFISDAGDMMRTYLSPVSEEETDISLIDIREDIMQAIIHGYLQEMGGLLSEAEKAHFVYAGKYMIYMQALRFLTDYLTGDKYYKPVYEDHNLNRAKNQVQLLKKFIEKEPGLSSMVEAFLNRHLR